jgi:NAD(P)-dependent dehydrogenase (short-subunit alcohol dehydrogenase family)
MKSVVITGASTGIGYGMAKVLIANGYRVFGSVRKPEDADRLVSELGAPLIPLIFDVTDRPAIDQAKAQVVDALGGETLAGLINNAGLAVSGPLLHIDPADMRRQLEINVVGMLHTTQVFAPLLAEDEGRKGAPGKVINISSVAGKRAMPFIGPYAVSKHGVEAFSHSLRRELLPFGVDVVIIGPGAVETPIWDKAESDDIEPYRDTKYYAILKGFREYMLTSGRKGLPTEQLGNLALKIFESDRPKTRYPIVPNYFQDWLLPKFMPDRVLDKVIGKQLGLARKD